MTLGVSADAPANVGQRVGSGGRAAHADIDVQLLVAEPTGGFGDLGVAASGELGDALDSFATLLRRRPTRSGGPDADVENAPGS